MRPGWRGWAVAALSGLALGLVGAAPPAAPTGDVKLGEAVYKEICFACHGPTGDGKGPSWLNTMPRPQVFRNPNYMGRLADQYLFEVVKYGKLAVLRREPPTTVESLAMPAFEDVLEEDQVRALVRFVRSFLDGSAQPAEARELYKDACETCHGPGGRGDGPRAISTQPAPRSFVSEGQPAPADYTDPLFMARFSDQFITALIKKGRIGVTEKAGFDTMNPYGHVLSDDEIWGLIRYIREVLQKP